MKADHLTARNLSYVRHDELADHLDQRRHQHGYTCNIEVVLDDGRIARLLHTSNAGFNGIQGTFDPDTGERAFTTSLGHIARWSAR